MPTPRGLNIRLVHAIRRLSQCKILNSPIALLESCCGNNLFLDQKIAMTLCTQQDDICRTECLYRELRLTDDIRVNMKQVINMINKLLKTNKDEVHSYFHILLDSYEIVSEMKIPYNGSKNGCSLYPEAVESHALSSAFVNCHDNYRNQSKPCRHLFQRFDMCLAKNLPTRGDVSGTNKLVRNLFLLTVALTLLLSKGEYNLLNNLI
ncbi:uncharacterized protein LOC108604943 [Drosophila busckii]|uniref:uncharacterized protein LOC108604943 n=1 Tax=Drosophila busckii TaxID=30019 RepID=UPI00083ED536|nr:uncharacterized protein LOC108604943 [Drosophila busckii]